MFKKNESQADRIVRIGLGVILLAGGLFMASGITEIVLLVLGAVALFTGLSGFCLIYKILGWSTKDKISQK